MRLHQIVKQASVCGLSGALLLATGCASIVGGRDQMISIDARTPSGHKIHGAQCQLVNSKGRWQAFSSESVTVHRAYGDLTVSCSKQGADIGSVQTASSVRNWMFGNLLLGGIVGAGVDMYTGAGFRYPEVITVFGSDVDADATSLWPRDGDFNAGSIAGGAGNATALRDVHRDVSSGVETMIAAHADWKNLCRTSGPAPTIHVLTQSEHGTIAIREGEFTPPNTSGAAGNAASTCANGKIYGTRIFYSPNPGFHGVDHLRYEVDGENGRFTRAVEMAVRSDPQAASTAFSHDQLAQ